MDFYYHPASPNCRKCMAALDLMEVPAERHIVDLPKGEQRSPEFLAINPNGRVPALVDGDLAIWESNVINIHLAEKTSSKLWPADHRRQQVLTWLFWEQAHLMYATGVPFFQIVLKPILGLGEPDQQRLDESYASFSRLMAVLDGQLADSPYIVGNRLSLADLAVAGCFSFADKTGLSVAEFPNVAAWLERMDGIPEWKASAPPPFG